MGKTPPSGGFWKIVGLLRILGRIVVDHQRHTLHVQTTCSHILWCWEHARAGIMAADTCTRFPRLSITSLKSHELKGFWSIKTWSAAQDFFTSKPSPGWFTVWGTILKGETFQKALRFRYICCTSPLMLLFLSLIGCSPKYPLTVDIFHESWKGAYLKYIALWQYNLDTNWILNISTYGKQHALGRELMHFRTNSHLHVDMYICRSSWIAVKDLWHK